MILLVCLGHGVFRPVAVLFFSETVFGGGLKSPNRGVVLRKKVVHLYRSIRRGDYRMLLKRLKYHSWFTYLRHRAWDVSFRLGCCPSIFSLWYPLLGFGIGSPRIGNLSNLGRVHLYRVCRSSHRSWRPGGRTHFLLDLAT